MACYSDVLQINIRIIINKGENAALCSYKCSSHKVTRTKTGSDPLIIGESSNEALVILATLWYIKGEQKQD